MLNNEKKSLREELCGLLQAAIFLFIIFWATGFGSWSCRTLPELIRDKNPNAHRRIEKQCEWGNLLTEKVRRAKAMGSAYGVPEYFADLRDAYTYEILYEVSITFSTNKLQELTRAETDRRWPEPDFQATLKREQDKTEAWRVKLKRELTQLIATAEAARGAKLPKAPPTPWYLLAWSVIVWLVTSYGKIAMLSALLFPLRAFGPKGNLRDLRSLSRWLLAVVRWPRDLWTYPFNTWREIVAEAEIRRQGRSWRKLLGPLSRADRKLLRRVTANHEYFSRWRQALRRKTVPRWSLITALGVMFVLLPLMSLAAPAVSDSGGEPTCVSASHILPVQQCWTDADPPWPVYGPEIARIEPTMTIEPLRPGTPRVFYDPEASIRPGPVQDIFHVPLSIQTLVV